MLILCGFVFFSTGRFNLSLALLFVLVFLRHCDHLAWGTESWSMCFLSIWLFVLHALIFILFLFLLVSGMGCGL